MAIDAGVDLLVFANQELFDPDIVNETVETIARPIYSGHINEARIDRSFARVNAIRPAR
jgi:beta-N-acetylhexosaminidase